MVPIHKHFEDKKRKMRIVQISLADIARYRMRLKFDDGDDERTEGPGVDNKRITHKRVFSKSGHSGRDEFCQSKLNKVTFVIL